jgi:hypothetical protein
VATVAEAALTPELALQYLGEISTDIKASVLIASDGSTAVTSRPGEAGDQLPALTAELFERASTGDGGVFAVRNERWTVAVVTGRFALSSLMFYDLRSVLGDLEAKPA